MRTLYTTAAMVLAFSGAAFANGWTLDPEASRLAFASIKSNDTGEVHHFERLSGTVSKDGQAVIRIDLNSIQTQIDIRDERIVEHVFQNTPEAVVTASIGMDTLSALSPGESTRTETEATLTVLRTEATLDATLFVARLSETRVLVTTDDMVFLTTDEIGVDGAIDTLQDLAGLSGITRAVPVTLRLMFDQD